MPFFDERISNGVETRTTAYPVQVSGYRFDIARPPPELGEHTEEVFEEWLGHEAQPRKAAQVR